MFSIEHLNVLRIAEVDQIAPLIGPHSRVLDIGAGTGQQAQRLAQLGHRVAAIDLVGSTYSNDEVFPVTYYDGRTIPFPEGSFDTVFSSNLLEHVEDLAAMHAEVRRVLCPGGSVIHILPTHVWRAWTSATAVPAAFGYVAAAVPELPGGVRRMARQVAGTLLPRRHGERGNILSETWLYHPRWWREHFIANGFQLQGDSPVGYFYTGNMLLGSRLSLRSRRRLSRVAGSACHVFILGADGRAGYVSTQDGQLLELASA